MWTRGQSDLDACLVGPFPVCQLRYALSPRPPVLSLPLYMHSAMDATDFPTQPTHQARGFFLSLSPFLGHSFPPDVSVDLSMHNTQTDGWI